MLSYFVKVFGAQRKRYKCQQDEDRPTEYHGGRYFLVSLPMGDPAEMKQKKKKEAD